MPTTPRNPSTSRRAHAAEDRTAGNGDRPIPRDDRPMAGFAMLVGVYGAGVAGASALAKRRGLPDRVSPWDLALIGVATHKMSRRISKDSVMSPLRAPFADFEGQSGPAEVAERPRGHGLKKAVGELITCPFCIGQWVATGLVFGLVFAPRATRLLASVFASAAIADFLQLAYARAEQAAEAS